VFGVDSAILQKSIQLSTATNNSLEPIRKTTLEAKAWLAGTSDRKPSLGSGLKAVVREVAHNDGLKLKIDCGENSS
jgi:hypothetical protein